MSGAPYADVRGRPRGYLNAKRPALKSRRAADDAPTMSTSASDVRRLMRGEAAPDAPAAAQALPPGAARLKRDEVIAFSTQLAVMLDAGVALGEALHCAAGQFKRPPAKQVLDELEADVTGGSDLSSALAKHPKSFPRVYVALVRASEKGGMLPKLLGRATEYLRDEREILRKVRGAVTYPGIMFGFAAVTSVFLLAFVLPRFAKIYEGKGAALPTPTKILMAASTFVVDHYVALIAGAAFVGGAAWWWLQTPGGLAAWQRFQLRLPLLGPMFRTLHLARGLRTVGTLASAGVPLLECVETAGMLTDNVRFRQLWTGAADGLRQGATLSQPLESDGLVPDPVVQMIKSGEKAGKLGSVTEQVAVHAETELKEQIAAMTRYIEPAMIIGMGILIGGVTLAMLLPVFSLSRVVAE